MDDVKDLPEDEENKSAISADLIRGHINTIILRTLYERDKYGYEIIEEIEKKSHGQYSLKQPTLYSALKRLESQGYINAYWKTDEVSLGGRRKYYTLTDSGREITEKNQAEWEYSRTVIDNLISDRSFDFNQPAPTSVDFKILKKSTSRVPVVKNGGEDDDDDDEFDDKPEIKASSIPEVEIKPETVTFTEQTVYYETVTSTVQEPQPIREVQKEVLTPPVQEPQPTRQIQEELKHTSSPVQEVQTSQEMPKTENTATENTIPFKNYGDDEHKPMDEEQRRIVHENYMRLISEPVNEPVQEVENIVPVADDIDTDKLIYNNKPETERDYRNLINNLFVKTIKRNPSEPRSEQAAYTKPVEPAIKLDDIADKADIDGLKVNSSEYVVNSRKRNYNMGGTLFKSSLIVSVVLLLLFMFSLIFKSKLGVSLAYPFVILAIDIAQVLIFGILYYTDLGKITRKPSSNIYLTASIIITVILILIIFIVSILLNVDFTSSGDVFAKIIIPIFTALNVSVFAGCFYAFTKHNN